MGVFIKEGNGMTFNEAIENLMENIKKDYFRWTNPSRVEGNMRDIKMESIDRFNDSVKFTNVNLLGNLTDLLSPLSYRY